MTRVKHSFIASFGVSKLKTIPLLITKTLSLLYLCMKYDLPWGSRRSQEMIHPGPLRTWLLPPQYPEVAIYKRYQHHFIKKYSYPKHTLARKVTITFPQTAPPLPDHTNGSAICHPVQLEPKRQCACGCQDSWQHFRAAQWQGMPRAHFETHSPRAPMEQPEALAFVGDIDQVARLALTSKSNAFSLEASWFQGSFHALVTLR